MLPIGFNPVPNLLSDPGNPLVGTNYHGSSLSIKGYLSDPGNPPIWTS